MCGLNPSGGGTGGAGGTGGEGGGGEGDGGDGEVAIRVHLEAPLDMPSVPFRKMHAF